jgi:hypothetical protein
MVARRLAGLAGIFGVAVSYTAGVALGCGHRGSAGTSSADAAPADPPFDEGPIFDATGRVPTYHRPAHASCSHDRGPGNTYAFPEYADSEFSECHSDDECTAGIDGRCLAVDYRDVCSYDECFADDDCGPGGVCDCFDDRPPGAGPAYARPGHRCSKGNCVVDADCGPPGWCSPGMDGPGWYCHTPRDQCFDLEDCSPLGCKRDVVSGTFGCFPTSGKSG